LTHCSLTYDDGGRDGVVNVIIIVVVMMTAARSALAAGVKYINGAEVFTDSHLLVRSSVRPTHGPGYIRTSIEQFVVSATQSSQPEALTDDRQNA